MLELHAGTAARNCAGLTRRAALKAGFLVLIAARMLPPKTPRALGLVSVEFAGAGGALVALLAVSIGPGDAAQCPLLAPLVAR